MHSVLQLIAAPLHLELHQKPINCAVLCACMTSEIFHKPSYRIYFPRHNAIISIQFSVVLLVVLCQMSVNGVVCPP